MYRKREKRERQYSQLFRFHNPSSDEKNWNLLYLYDYITLSTAYSKSYKNEDCARLHQAIRLINIVYLVISILNNTR